MDSTTLVSDTSSATANTKQEKFEMRSNKRSHCGAVLAIVALTFISSTDTSHAFSESFPQRISQSPSQVRLPQHQSLFSNPSTNTYTHPLHTNTRNNHPSRTNSNTALFYAPNHQTTQTAPMVAQAFYASHKSNRNPTKPKTRNSLSSTMPLSNSVLSSSDTLPSFPTAHGLLSPETVMRMEVMTSRGSRDHAVDFFLDTYRKEGPMACLPMLSDEHVLPRLTEAMRDIVA